MKDSYKKLSEKMENKKKMEDLFLKLDYEKNLLVYFSRKNSQIIKKF